MIFRFCSWDFFWLASLSIAFSLVEAENNNDECTLYLAESSTSTEDHYKWGLFAGMDIDKDQLIGQADVAVQILNLAANSQTQEEAEMEYTNVDDLPHTIKVVDHLEQYVWVAEMSGGQFEIEDGTIVSAVPGAGILGSHNPEYTNADWNHFSAYNRRLLGEKTGVNHPGRGAYSNFYNVSLRSLIDIPLGMEIFLDFGDNYETDEDEKEVKLVKDDYKKIDKVVDRILGFMDKFKDELTPESEKDIYDFLVRDVLRTAAGKEKGIKAISVLPPNPDDLHLVKEAGGSFAYSEPDVVRNKEWLRTNGYCMDNIKAGTSTIANAGRGAFAVRSILKGGLVSPVPLVHIASREIFNMYNVSSAIINEGSDEEEEYYFRTSNHVTGTQMLYNYVFGHPESSVYFFPSGTAVSLINHHPEPNAKLVWSKSKHHHSEWFDLPPEEVLSSEKAQDIGLMMEVIALRDIEKDEEIFLDYGMEWSTAWDAHVKKWNEKVANGLVNTTWPKKSIDLNEEHIHRPYKIPTELKNDPYPSNTRLMCFLVIEEIESSGSNNDDEKLRIWAKPKRGTVYHSEHLFDCRVTQRIEIEKKNKYDEDAAPLVTYNYTVQWGAGANELSFDEDSMDKSTLVDRVPHEALVFIDEPFSSDLHSVEDHFRHYIGIPDEIFPKGPWRNLAQEVTREVPDL